MVRTYIQILLLTVMASVATQTTAEPAQEKGTTYLQLNPAFTTNVGKPGTRVSFAKVDVSLRLVGPAEKERAQHHQPAIRDILVSAFSNQPLPSVETSQGLETLRTETLQKLQGFLEAEEGQPLVTDLLFTSLVVQR